MASEQQGIPKPVIPQNQSDNSPKGPGRLSEEESNILKECEKESFFRRAVPLSCGSIIGVNYLVATGKLAAHPKFGSLPKSIIAAGLAYLVGKISYLPQCRKKILEKIPDSSLAETIRKAQGGHTPDLRTDHSGSSTGGSDEAKKDDQSRFRNVLRNETPTYEGLKDSDRPSLDNEVKMPDAPQEKKSTTYEDLRKKNRQDYNDNLGTPAPPRQPGSPSYKDSPYMPQKAWPDKKSPSAPEDAPEPEPYQAPPKRKRTNMWGDAIDD